MQDSFTAAKYKSVQYGCISEIEQAIKRNAPIVFVEYRYSGKTVESLKQLVAAVKYENVHTVTKTTNNGALAINKLLQRKKLPKNHLRVCGVNTDCCVLETIEGFNLDEEFLNKIYPTDNLCPLLKIPLFRGEKNSCPNSPTLDRIDSSKGYTKDNVQVISLKANTAKSNLSLDEMKLLVYNWELLHNPTTIFDS